MADIEQLIHSEEDLDMLVRFPMDNQGRICLKFKNSGGLIYSLVLIALPTFVYYIVM